jgi:hypothetical protein
MRKTPCANGEKRFHRNRIILSLITWFSGPALSNSASLQLKGMGCWNNGMLGLAELDFFLHTARIRNYT